MYWFFFRSEIKATEEDVYLWECSLSAGQAPFRCHPSWHAGLVGQRAACYVLENRKWAACSDKTVVKKKLTFCEDLEVFNWWGSSFFLIWYYCGQVLKYRGSSETRWHNCSLPTRFSLYSCNFKKSTRTRVVINYSFHDYAWMLLLSLSIKQRKWDDHTKTVWGELTMTELKHRT